jgi:hypothetical protein
MSCLHNNDFQPDFFNNIAAVAVVLMLTKVVMHRSRQVHWCRSLVVINLVVHAFAVLAAAAAIWVSLSATDVCNTHPEWHRYAWYALAFAAGAFLIDILIEDVVGAWMKNRTCVEN